MQSSNESVISNHQSMTGDLDVLMISISTALQVMTEDTSQILNFLINHLRDILNTTLQTAFLLTQLALELWLQIILCWGPKLYLLELDF